MEDGAQDGAEAEEEKNAGCGDQTQQQGDFDWRKVLRFGEIHKGMISRTG